LTLTDWLNFFIWSDCNRNTIAIKRVLARQLAEEMQRKKVTKAEIAIKMQTRRAQLDRLLNSEKTGVSSDTIQRAASVVGRQLRVELIWRLSLGDFWRVRSPFFPLLLTAIRIRT
jgi:antitoxin HicB